MKKIFKFNLDIKDRGFETNANLVRGDNTSVFVIKLLDDGKEFRIPNDVTIDVHFKKSDGTFVVVTGAGKFNNEIRVNTPANALSSPGRNWGEVRLMKGAEVLTSARFDFFVRDNVVNNESIESTSEYDSLERLVTKAGEMEKALIEAKSGAGDLNTNIVEGRRLKTSLDESIRTGTMTIMTSRDTNVSLTDTTKRAEDTDTALKGTITDARSIGGNINRKIKVVDGWIANPEQLRGPKGDQGPTGDVGPQGPAGPASEITKTGIDSRGNTTVTFNDGTTITVAKGPQGLQGPKGDAGSTGPQGPQGERGLQGPKGDPGPRGPEGPQGPAGPPGKNATTTDVATVGKDGLMSSSDKFKLMLIQEGATKTEIVDSLDESTAGKALDARQGKILKVEMGGKQDKLTPGDNIAIRDGVISAKDTIYDDKQIKADLAKKADKADVLTELDVQALIDKAGKLKKEIVAKLPETGKEDIIYLVKTSGGKAGDVYEEFLWIDGKFELIGSTRIDLTNKVDKVPGKGLSSNDFTDGHKAKVDAIPDDAKYTDTLYDDSDIRELVADKADKADLAGKADKSDLDTKADKAELSNKQDKLTPGDNVTIDGGVISAVFNGTGIKSLPADWFYTYLEPGIYQQEETGYVYIAYEPDKNAIDSWALFELVGSASARMYRYEGNGMYESKNAVRLIDDVTLPDELESFKYQLEQDGLLVSAEDKAKLDGIQAGADKTPSSQPISYVEGLQGVLDGKADVTDLASKADVTALEGKQDKLTPGDNITIQDGVISSTASGGSSAVWLTQAEYDGLASKDPEVTYIIYEEVL